VTPVEHRPDVAGSERRVAAANAQIGEARAAFFPSLVLNAEGGLQGNHLSNWFLAPSRFWSIGPSAAETLFDGDKRRGALAQNKAAYVIALAFR
jgi:outer membrane protein TolC